MKTQTQRIRLRPALEALNRGLAALLLVGSAGLAAAASPAPTSDHYATSTYRERTPRLTAMVDAWPASLRASAAFIPVPVAIGLRSAGKPVRFQEESFILVDSTGTEYPLASYGQISRDYPMRSFDASLFAQRPMIIGTQFAGMRRASSRFFPAPGRGTRTESVELSAFTWFQDVLYFPRPAVLSGTLTLRIQSKGLPEPVDVRFQLPRTKQNPQGSALD